jgi:hypothetical protein
MRLPSTVDAVITGARKVGPHGLVLRGIVAGAAAGCWAVAGALGRVSLPATVVLVLVVLAAVSRPDSGAPLVLIVALTATWVIEVRPMSIAWSLALGLAVLVVHAASARAAALGDGGVLDARVARRWLAQTAAVAVVTTALWAVVVILGDASVSGGIAVSAAAIAAVALLAFFVVRSSADGPPV